MKKLNRKEYKKQIKIFRHTNKIAQIQHQWVRFTDEYCNEVLMFVHNSIIKRVKTNPSACPNSNYYLFDVGNHKAHVELYGHPSIAYNTRNGLKISGGISRFRAHKYCDFRVLTEDEVKEEYDKIFAQAKYAYFCPFKKKLHKYYESKNNSTDSDKI